MVDLLGIFHSSDYWGINLSRQRDNHKIPCFLDFLSPPGKFWRSLFNCYGPLSVGFSLFGWFYQIKLNSANGISLVLQKHRERETKHEIYETWVSAGYFLHYWSCKVRSLLINGGFKLLHTTFMFIGTMVFVFVFYFFASAGQYLQKSPVIS